MTIEIEHLDENFNSEETHSLEDPNEPQGTGWGEENTGGNAFQEVFDGIGSTGNEVGSDQFWQNFKISESDVETVPIDGNRVHKSYMYTINNYDENDVKRLQAMECTYHVFGREVGEQGTPHLQGCITFKKGMRFNAAKRVLKGHLTVPKVIEAARNYCLKDGDVYVKDNRHQGSRSDLLALAQYVKTGKRISSTAMEYPVEFIKYHRGIEKLTNIVFSQRSTVGDRRVIWVYGPTGSGKSYPIFQSNANAWSSGDRLEFFNGYENQEVAIFDDFRGSTCRFSFFLRLLDVYPLTVDVKCGHVAWTPSTIYITSCHAPDKCYMKEPEDQAQIIRRCTEIYECHNKVWNDKTSIFKKLYNLI